MCSFCIWPDAKSAYKYSYYLHTGDGEQMAAPELYVGSQIIAVFHPRPDMC
jgi:hypothetical protein